MPRKREEWHTIHLRTATKDEVTAWKKAIEKSRRERGIFPPEVTYDYVIHLMEQQFDPDEDLV